MNRAGLFMLPITCDQILYYKLSLSFTHMPRWIESGIWNLESLIWKIQDKLCTNLHSMVYSTRIT